MSEFQKVLNKEDFFYSWARQIVDKSDTKQEIIEAIKHFRKQYLNSGGDGYAYWKFSAEIMVSLLCQICYTEGVLYFNPYKRYMNTEIFLSEKEYYLYIRKLSINERAKFLSFSS